jgi:hypothetical protein
MMRRAGRQGKQDIAMNRWLAFEGLKPILTLKPRATLIEHKGAFEFA